MLIILILIILLIFCILSLHVYFFLENKKLKKIKYNYNLNYDEYKFLNEVNLIGTHNSLTYKIKNLFSPFAKTQNYNLLLQLKKNVRFFDLRFKIENNILEGYHNFVKLNINHKEVFKTFIDFLDKNPTEFIVITLKNENFKNHSDIFKFLDNYIIENKLEDYFHYNKLDWDYIPQIRNLKKRIYILNFIKKNNGDIYYLPWRDNATFLQGSINISDCYKISDYEKIKVYKEFDKNLSDKNLNIFFFSSEYKYLFGVYFYNKFFKKKLQYNLDFKQMKNKKKIYVFDFIDLYQNFILDIYEE